MCIDISESLKTKLFLKTIVQSLEKVKKTVYNSRDTDI